MHNTGPPPARPTDRTRDQTPNNRSFEHPGAHHDAVAWQACRTAGRQHRRCVTLGPALHRTEGR